MTIPGPFNEPRENDDNASRLEQRVAYLEQLNRWYLFSLELSASMAHLHGRSSSQTIIP